jgi:hypothetical protein
MTQKAEMMPEAQPVGRPELPPAEIIEFPNDPEMQPDYLTVRRWLRLADEMLNGSEPKKA